MFWEIHSNYVNTRVSLQNGHLGESKLYHTISVLYRAHLCMKCSLGISHFLEEISSLSHSVVFLYFFALIAEEGCLISSCYSLELCIQTLISFLFSFAFRFPGGSEVKESASNAGDPDLIPGSGRSPGEGKANHSSILAWRIPWTEKPGRLQSMGSQRVGHD